MVEMVDRTHLTDRAALEEIRLAALLEDVPRTTMVGRAADRPVAMGRLEETEEVESRTGTLGLGSAIPSSTVT